MNKIREKSKSTGLEIAVIGMACRFPGAGDVDQFWENLINGVESISFFTEEELIASGVNPGLVYQPNFIKAKGALEDVEYFDAAFFDYSPRDAQIMDPQMRLLHECSWQAIEDAGYDPNRYKGLIGVYAGNSNNIIWLNRLLTQLSLLEQHGAIGLNFREYLAPRIAYKLNLKGPAVTIQTACSTSLVAIHQACQGLLAGETDLALAGGVTVSLPIKDGYLYHEGMILSPDGHCRAFDAEAKGTVFGNGVGVVVLKRLTDAIRDGDYIHAVIKGSAINNDGSQKVGFTAPSIKGQAAVIKTAQYVAEVEPESISYIETHGTGTALGDPIEIEALKKAFSGVKEQGVCKIGSVKTNLGHLEAAAGVSAFIKTVLSLKNRQIPPSLNYSRPNPRIDFANSLFEVNTRAAKWKSDQYPLRAGVSSFGMGGTNAHVILEEAPEYLEVSKPNPFELILLSARTAAALQKQAENLRDYLLKYPQTNLADLAYTLQVGRANFAHRRLMVVAGSDELLQELQSEQAQIFAVQDTGKSLIFMFAGQGSHYLNMGRQLYQEIHSFREELDHCFELVKKIAQIDLKSILFPKKDAIEAEKKLQRTEFVQPIVFSFEYALARLLHSWGLQPTALIGYSLGELAAATLAGVFTLEDALRLVIVRGKLMQQVLPGAMLSVPLSQEELEPLLGDDLSLAIINGPSCVVAGESEVIDQFAEKMREKRLICTRLALSHAGHSHLMEPIIDEFRHLMEMIKLTPPRIPMISNITGSWLTTEQAVDPEYWVQQLRKPVRFAEGIEKLIGEKSNLFIEIGPGRDLSVLLRRYISKTEERGVNLIRPEKREISDVQYLLQKLGRLWLLGLEIDWSQLYIQVGRRRIPLPTYPFERQRYWIEGDQLASAAAVKEDVLLEVENSPAQNGKETTDTNGYYSRPSLSANYLAPRNEIEEFLVNLWQRSFGIMPIGIEDDFFELGGDSLKAVTIAVTILDKFRVELPMTEFFKEPTITWMAKRVADSEKFTIYSIKPAEKKERYRLSSEQRRLYSLHARNSENIVYNTPAILTLEGDIQLEKIGTIFAEIIKRHEILRTFFELYDGEPTQRIVKQVNFWPEYKEIRKEEIDFQIREFIRPFNLEKAPLMRLGLFKVSADCYILILDMHHIISDAVSMGIMVDEFLQLYAGRTVQPVKIQYKDYAEWQYTEERKAILQKQEFYWLEQFAGAIPVLELPTDYPRPARQQFTGNITRFIINNQQKDSLQKIASAEDATLYMIFLAILNILCAKLSGQEDIVIGTVTAGRRHPDLHSVIGMFVNTLALRNYPAGEKGFVQFLREVRERTLQAFDNQEYLFEDLVKKVAIRKDRSRNPLFDVILVSHNLGIQEVELPGLKVSPYEFDMGISMFDLRLIEVEVTEGVLFTLEYNTALFKKETIDKFVEYFQEIITQIIENKEIVLANLTISHTLLAPESTLFTEDQGDFVF